MVCRFMDSFDYYPSGDASFQRKWDNAAFTLLTTANQRTGTSAVSIGAGAAQFSRTFDDQASWIVGFAVRMTKFPEFAILEFRDVSTAQCSLKFRGDGTLEVVRDTATAVAGGVSTLAVLHTNRYVFIEIKVTIANSIAASSCVVRVNEQVVITVDAGEDLQVTGNPTADTIHFRGVNTVTMTIDDVYIFDGTDGGGTEPTNDDFAGDVTVKIHLPDGNGTTNNFTGSDADSVDNYLLVDENPTDNDTTYVESSTIGHIDLYTVDNLADTPLDFKAIQINNVVRKDDSGTKTVRAVVRPASTNFFGASKSPVDGTYTNEIEILNEDPETEAAWTESGFNATEFGLEIET